MSGSLHRNQGGIKRKRSIEILQLKEKLQSQFGKQHDQVINKIILGELNKKDCNQISINEISEKVANRLSKIQMNEDHQQQDKHGLPIVKNAQINQIRYNSILKPSIFKGEEETQQQSKQRKFQNSSVQLKKNYQIPQFQNDSSLIQTSQFQQENGKQTQRVLSISPLRNQILDKKSPTKINFFNREDQKKDSFSMPKYNQNLYSSYAQQQDQQQKSFSSVKNQTLIEGNPYLEKLLTKANEDGFDYNSTSFNIRKQRIGQGNQFHLKVIESPEVGKNLLGERRKVKDFSSESFELPSKGQRKNYTMWDILALQQSYKQRMDDEQQKQQLKSKQNYLKSYLEGQMTQKKQINNQDSIQKKQDKQELETNLRKQSYIDEKFISQKQQKLRDVSNENATQFKNLSHMNAENTFLVKQLILEENNKTNEKYQIQKQMKDQDLKTIQQLRREDMLEQIKIKQKSKEQLQKLQQFEEQFVINEQVKRLQNRDKNLADHLKRIQERDDKLYNYFNQKEMMTFTKQENVKVGKIENKATKEAEELKQKTINDEEEKKMRRSNQLHEYSKNLKQAMKMSQLKKEHKINSLNAFPEDFEKALQQRDQEDLQFQKKLVEDYYMEQLKKQRESLKKQTFKSELEKQIKEKEVLNNFQRVYLDKKQLALNAKAFQNVITASPEVFTAEKGKISQDISKDDEALANEISRLNKLLS